MYKSDLAQIMKPASDGRYNDLESMDMMLNYDNNEFMNSDFFDTIRSVESDIQHEYLDLTVEAALKESEGWGSVDGFNTTSSDSSSHTDGFTSPRNDASETEGSCIFTDESVSPARTIDVDDSLYDLLKPLETIGSNFKIETVQPVVVNQMKPTKIIIQNSANKKVVNKQIINATQMKKIGKKQILKVQSLAANGKPVILPYGLKSIKILNANDLKAERIQVTTLPTSSVCRRKIDSVRIKEDPDSNVPSSEQAVRLTSEEKRLLDKEGIQMPAYHPLTKMEDRELKRIRRKIRNKISAQDSRKRKKEYVDGLEARVRRGSEENRNLMQRVKELQKKNKTLMAHINKLQSLIFNSTSSKATPSTCLMIVMLSVLLVSLPSIRLAPPKERADVEPVSISRSLLSTEDDAGMEEFFVFRDEEGADGESNNTENEVLKAIEELEGKYETMAFEKDASDEHFFTSLVNNVKGMFAGGKKKSGALLYGADYGGYENKRGFIEPEIDDFEEAPAKRAKLVDEYRQNDENFVPLNKVVTVVAETKNK